MLLGLVIFSKPYLQPGSMYVLAYSHLLSYASPGISAKKAIRWSGTPFGNICYAMHYTKISTFAPVSIRRK